MPKSAFSPGGADLVGKNPWQAVTAERMFGTAAGGSASGSGSPGTVTLSAPTGVASGAPVSGSGSGSPGTVTVSAPTGVGSDGTNRLFMLVIAGQSNAEGRATATDGVDRTTIDVDVANFYQYPGQPGQPGYQTLTNDTTPLIHYSGYTRTNSVLGPGEYQGKQILADNPGSVVIAIPTAVGSTTIVTSTAVWAPSLTPGAGGSLYENMISQIVTDYGKALTDFPGRTIQIIIDLVLGESDATNGVTYSTYYNALANFVNYSIARLAAAGIPNTSGIKFVFGSMIPRLWDPTSPVSDANHATVNRATVMASVNLPNVLYSRGNPGNDGSPTGGGGGDGLHYLPVANTRLQGTRLGLTLSDTVGPTMTGPATFTSQYGQKLQFFLSNNDDHATYEIVAGLDGALFELSDPYITPYVRWVGDGTGPAPGNYQVNIRARDGSGNYGPTRTYTIPVAYDVNPATFFTNGELGRVITLEFANLSQTIDGLTPVTAYGQPVGWVRDQSPNANHWKAVANDGTRPTIQLDSNGFPYLAGDGIDDVMFANPTQTSSSVIWSAVMGMMGAAPASTKVISGTWAASGGFAQAAPFEATSTGGVTIAARNDTSAGIGTAPVLPSIFDGTTTHVVTSEYTGPSLPMRLRDAASRPADGGDGSWTQTTSSGLGGTFTWQRDSLFANGTPALWFPGRVYAHVRINRKWSNAERKSAEDFIAKRSLAALIPGANFNVNAAGSVGTVAVSAPTGTASGGSVGSSSGNGAGSPGVVTLSAVGGNVVGSANASGSIGSVTLFPPIGSQTSVLPVTLEEALTLEEVKDYLGIFTSDKDYALERMIPRARLWVEDHTGLAIAKRQFVERLRPTISGVIRLSKGPVSTVESVTYLDSAGEEVSITPSFYSPTGTLTYPGGWPSLNANEAFTVTYTAGADAEDIDDRLKGAMFALIEGEFMEGYAYPDRATQAAERCCTYLRQMVA
jgi:uncharacterized phiE125 gp8 family phage protein